MFIPLEEPDWVKFYWDAKKQDVPLSSRYVGVYIRVQHTGIGPSLSFVARVTDKGRNVQLGAYPFTKEGELRAAERYEAHCRWKGIRPYRVTSGRTRFQLQVS